MNLNDTNDEKIDNPHDKRFKELFSSEKRFLEFLVDCVKEPWVKDLTVDSLRKSERSFILQDFKEQEADIVYEANLNGNNLIFYILLEHQSKVDYRMPYRLLLYKTEIIRQYYNNADPKKRDAKEFKFPGIFPIVLFTGSGKWTVPLSAKDMFESSELLGKYILDFEYFLIDAKRYSDDDLKNFSSRILGVILLLEKSRTDIEFYSNIRNSLNDIQGFNTEESRVLNFCIKIIDIAYGYNKHEDIKMLLEENNTQEVDSMLCDVIENAKYEKERLIATGIREGIQQGIQEGIQEGIQQGEMAKSFEIAKSLLAEGVSIDIIERCTTLSKEQIGTIKLD